MNTSGESSSHNNTTTTLNMLEFQGYNQEDHQHNQASILSWPVPPPIHSLNLQHNHALCNTDRDFFFPSSFPPLPPPPSPLIPSLHPYYEDLYSRRASAPLQFAYDGGGCNLDPLGLAGFYNYVGSHDMGRGVSSPASSLPFGSLHTELGEMSAQEIMDAKALAASKSHSEAERRRRERINVHLTKLRSLLPSTTKTDKASLLAEVIQHVKELKRQTSKIAEESPLPTESDELTVDATNDDDGKFVIKASLCCDDRSDLLPELIKTLKALRLRPLKAEVTTLGGRVKNVLVITGDKNFDQSDQQSIASIQDAFKAVMERAAASHEQPSAVCSIKRQRTTNLFTILEHNSI